MAREPISIKLDVKQQKVLDDLQRILATIEDCRILSLNDPGPTDILILETGRDVEKDFELIGSLLSLGAVEAIFLTAPKMESELLLRGMRAGVREFFPQPIQADEVRQALSNFMGRQSPSQRLAPKQGHIIDVIGGKGGIGTTTIAVNLATTLALKAYGRSVVLIDMNRMFGEIPLFLGLEPTYHWGEIARNISRLDPTFLMSILAKHSSGVYVLPSPSQLGGDNPATPDVIAQVLRLMEAHFDFIVIDSGQSFDPVSLKVLEMAHTALLITVLSLPCLANTRKILTSLNTLGYPPAQDIKVVVNRYFKNPDISLEEAEAAIGKAIDFTVPNDYKAAMSALNQGKPLVEAAGRVPLTRSMEQLAAKFLQGEKEEPPQKKGIFGLKLFGKG